MKQHQNQKKRQIKKQLKLNKQEQGVVDKADDHVDHNDVDDADDEV